MRLVSQFATMRLSFWWSALAVVVFGASSCSDDPNQIHLFESEAPVDVACVPDLVCASPTPYCFGNLCVACLTDTNCGNKFCEPSSHTCVDCVTSGDCKNDKPYCFANKCRQCLVPENCGDPLLSCDTREGKCVPSCQRDEDCEEPDAICAPEMAVCVACELDVDCPMERPHCEANRCVGCTTDDDCDPAKPLCEPDKFECVECLGDADCGAGRTCDMKKCSP